MYTSSPHVKTSAPSRQDAQIARESSVTLAPLLQENNDAHTHLVLRTEDDGEADIALPAPLLHLLLQALQEMAKGNAVSLNVLQTEMTTQQAAELLRVSRPSLIKMLDEGKLPYRKVGAHRRIRSDDALRYMEAERARRIRVMEELVSETENLGLYE